MKQGGKQTTAGKGHPMHVAIMITVTQEQKFVGERFFLYSKHICFLCYAATRL